MNRKKITYMWLYTVPALLLLSCTQEEMPVPCGASDSDDIIFHTSLPGLETRSYDNIHAGDLYGGFSVAALNLERTGAGNLELYFQDQLVTRTDSMGDAFRGPGCKWPKSEDGRDGKLKFFAYYPSIETLKGKLVVDPGDKTDYFLVHHSPLSTLNADGTYSFNYRMGNFKVNKDISTHADFVSASVEGSKKDNLFSGVNLEFQHKLCRVDLKAWNGSESYDIEVAGVRICGGVIVKSTYNLAGNWISHAADWGDVEYIFREGDTVVRLGSGNYATDKDAVSIMGNGGYALVIPHQLSNISTSLPYIWDYKNDPTHTKTYTNNGNTTKHSKGMFFSVLLRVIDKTDDQGLVLYPYVDGATITGTATASNKNSVYFAVEKATGKITGRVYKNKTTKQYFSDSALKNPYSVGDGLEIREYSWAAIPYRAQWSIGNTYTYVLDYTNGVGVHAPDDDAPGKAIITPLSVSVGEEKDLWVSPYKEEEVELIKGEGFIQE